jgi:hypothetical protein
MQACVHNIYRHVHAAAIYSSSDIKSRWKASPRVTSRRLQDVRRPGSVVADLIGTSTRDRDLEADGAAANQGLRPLRLQRQRPRQLQALQIQWLQPQLSPRDLQLLHLQLRPRLLHACLQKLQRPCRQRLRPLLSPRMQLLPLRLRPRLLHACLQKLQRPRRQRLRPLRLRPLHPRRPLQIQWLQPLQRLSPRPLQLLPRRLQQLLLHACLQKLQRPCRQRLWPLPPRPLQPPRQLQPRHLRQIRMWIPRSRWRWGGV